MLTYTKFEMLSYTQFEILSYTKFEMLTYTKFEMLSYTEFNMLTYKVSLLQDHSPVHWWCLGHQLWPVVVQKALKVAHYWNCHV